MPRAASLAIEQAGRHRGRRADRCWPTTRRAPCCSSCPRSSAAPRAWRDELGYPKMRDGPHVGGRGAPARLTWLRPCAGVSEGGQSEFITGLRAISCRRRGIGAAAPGINRPLRGRGAPASIRGRLAVATCAVACSSRMSLRNAARLRAGRLRIAAIDHLWNPRTLRRIAVNRGYQRHVTAWTRAAPDRPVPTRGDDLGAGGGRNCGRTPHESQHGVAAEARSATAGSRRGSHRRQRRRAAVSRGRLVHRCDARHTDQRRFGVRAGDRAACRLWARGRREHRGG